MEKPFEHVAVVGSGILGTQIAMLAAYAGYKVCVYDIREGAFDETYAKLYADLKAKGMTLSLPWISGRNAKRISGLRRIWLMRSKTLIWL